MSTESGAKPPIPKADVAPDNTVLHFAVHYSQPTGDARLRSRQPPLGTKDITLSPWEQYELARWQEYIATEGSDITVSRELLAEWVQRAAAIHAGSESAPEPPSASGQGERGAAQSTSLGLSGYRLVQADSDASRSLRGCTYTPSPPANRLDTHKREDEWRRLSLDSDIRSLSDPGESGSKFDVSTYLLVSDLMSHAAALVAEGADLQDVLRGRIETTLNEDEFRILSIVASAGQLGDSVEPRAWAYDRGILNTRIIASVLRFRREDRSTTFEPIQESAFVNAVLQAIHDVVAELRQEQPKAVRATGQGGLLGLYGYRPDSES